MTELSGLYYPFSRCINPSSLKQLLLVFDQVSFLDPVDDEGWRAKLMGDLEYHDPSFANYRKIERELMDLIDGECIRRIDPSGLGARHRKIAAASALSDLSDSKWTSVASQPNKFGMPSIVVRGRQSWQIFRSKLPDDFVDSLRHKEDFHRHLISEGDDNYSWSLSYAAGSAIGIGVHLEIAEELRLAPVTDSDLHHRLLMMKVARANEMSDKETPIPDDAIRLLTIKIATALLSDVLPERRLRDISFKEIVSFRRETESVRSEFISDIQSRLGRLRATTTAEDWRVTCNDITSEIHDGLRKYRADFESNRDRIWPGIVESMRGAIVPGSVVGTAVTLSHIGSPGQALLASVVAGSIGTLKTVLDLRAEGRKLRNSAAPAVAYLSRVQREVS